MLPVQHEHTASPARLLESRSDRFGAFEAVAYSTIKLAPHVSEDELSMDPLVALAVLEFADDLRAALASAIAWGEPPGEERQSRGSQAANSNTGVCATRSGSRPLQRLQPLHRLRREAALSGPGPTRAGTCSGTTTAA